MAASFLHAHLHLERPDFHLDAELTAPRSGFTAVFGPSGSGKTTLLRCLAGLERAQGEVLVAGETWQDASTFRPPHRRPLGYVFQEANLFPHRTVAGNLRYGYKRGGGEGPDWAEVVALLGLEGLLDRRPHQLSGGQRQRAALARALLAGPRLLLLDEPLAALDQASRTDILPYLERLRDELALPAVYVSHSPEEVTRLADHLVLLEEGRVAASGTPESVLTRPDLAPARSREAEARIQARVAGHDPDDGLLRLAFPGGELEVAHPPLAQGTPVRVGIPARDVSLTLDPPGRTSILNILPARVTEIADADGGEVLVRLDASGTPLLARITRRSANHMGLTAGTDVYAQVKSIALTT